VALLAFLIFAVSNAAKLGSAYFDLSYAYRPDSMSGLRDIVEFGANAPAGWWVLGFSNVEFSICSPLFVRGVAVAMCGAVVYAFLALVLWLHALRRFHAYLDT
jgi:hypothetical protein